jgi:hypothetical protein
MSKKDKRAIYNLELVKKVADKCTTICEFRTSYPGHYNWAQRKGHLKIVCKNLLSTRFKTKEWSLPAVKKEAKKYKSKVDFVKYSSGAYYWATKNGKIDEVCSHFKTNNIKWNLEMAKEIASKYKSFKDFREHEPKCFSYFRRKHPEILKYFNKNENLWNIESLKLEAQKYSTRFQFQKCAGGAYNYARRKGVLEEVCDHMERVVQYRESKFGDRLSDKIKSKLNSLGINFKLHREYHTSDGKSGRIDFLLELENILIPIEVKHDDSSWSELEIKRQLKKYDNYFHNAREMVTLKTILVSPFGRYGIPEDVFLGQLVDICKSNLSEFREAC